MEQMCRRVIASSRIADLVDDLGGDDLVPPQLSLLDTDEVQPRAILAWFDQPFHRSR